MSLCFANARRETDLCIVFMYLPNYTEETDNKCNWECRENKLVQSTDDLRDDHFL